MPQAKQNLKEKESTLKRYAKTFEYNLKFLFVLLNLMLF